MKSLKKTLHWGRKIDRWLARRPWRIFILATPTLLAGLLLTFVAGLLLFSQQTSRSLNQRYDRITQWALMSGRFEEARVASLHGLNTAKSERDRAQQLFYLALSLNGLGKKVDAMQLMNVAAPPDHPGCVEAHLFMAQSLLSSTNIAGAAIPSSLNLSNVTAETLRLVERHLTNAVVLEPDSLEANELLGRFYINTRKPAKARNYLMKIYSAKPETALLLAVTWAQEKDSANTILWSDRAIAAYENNLVKSAPRYEPADRLGLVQALGMKQMFAPRRDTPVTPATASASTSAAPQDSPAFWIGVVRLLLIKGKFGPALETLEQQMLVTTNAIYPAAVADICAAWAGNLPPSQKNGPALRLQLIEKGLTNAPQHLKLQLLLVEATHSADATGPAAKKFMDDSVAGATGDAAAWWNFVLWTDARIRGDLKTAREHLQTAYKLAPEIPQIQNDMAMDLSTGSQPDLQRGLQIIQSLVKKFPYEPGFRDTRGQILAKLGRREEAVADLEFAVPRMRNAAESQKLLAQLDAALGRTPSAPQARVAELLREVRNLAVQQKFTEALAKLEAGMKETPNPAYADAIAQLCIAWLERIPAAQADDRLRLIQKGLAYDPQDAELKSLLIQATHGPGNPGAAAKRILDQMVAGAAGDASADWHYFLGQDARYRGDLTSARQQLETAYEIAPDRTQIKSDLAAILISGNRDDWERGLELIKPALDQFPNNAEYRNTRGLLLAKLGQYKTAAPDLEMAADKLPNPGETRLALAAVYDALGKPQLAEQQRKLAGAPEKR